MSNTYNNELEQALKKVSNQLETSELTESNLVDSAKINLYYAHGLTEKASEKLSGDQANSQVAGKQFQAATNAFRVTENIVNDANSASLDTGNTTSTVSTAAASFQTAANALTNLWADTAAVLAVATSVDNHDKIQEMAQKSNMLTSIAAKSAEEATLISLNTTIEASQSRAANVVTQAGVVKTDMQNLESALETGFSTLQDQVNTDLGELSDAIESESQKSGALNIATAEETALQDAENFMNKEVNNNLLWTPGDSEFGDKFQLSFDRFKEYEADFSGDPCKINTKSPLKGTKIISEYRLMIVPADEVPSFDIQIAKAIANDNSKGSKNIHKYVSIAPDKKDNYITQYYLTEYFAMHPDASEPDENGETLKYIAYDYNGKPVKRGEMYGFFVYVIYTPEYQAVTSDTEGYLSLSSALFTNTSVLPSPAPSSGTDYCKSTDEIYFCFGEKDGSETARVSFRIPEKKMILPNSVDLDMFMEFRIFILSEENKEALCENLNIQDKVVAVNSNRASLNDAENQLEQSEEAYSTAAAEGKPKEIMEKLEKDIQTAQKNVGIAQIKYKHSVSVLNASYLNKISDFYMDTMILQNVPEAYTLTASRSKDKGFLDSLIAERDALVEEESTLKTQISESEKKAKALNKRVIDLEKKLKTDQKEIKDLKAINADLMANAKSNFRKLVEISELEALILDLEYLLGLQSNLPRNLEKEEKELIELIINDLQQIKTNETTIESKQDQNIDRLEEINDINSQITIINAQLQIYIAELAAIPKAIENLNAEIKKYESGNEDDKKFFYYEAENNDGDFTNNYGELLMPGESYTALVLSVIKASRSDVESQYESIYSQFSEPQTFKGIPQNN